MSSGGLRHSKWRAPTPKTRTRVLAWRACKSPRESRHCCDDGRRPNAVRASAVVLPRRSSCSMCVGTRRRMTVTTHFLRGSLQKCQAAHHRQRQYRPGNCVSNGLGAQPRELQQLPRQDRARLYNGGISRHHLSRFSDDLSGRCGPITEASFDCIIAAPACPRPRPCQFAASQVNHLAPSRLREFVRVAVAGLQPACSLRTACACICHPKRQDCPTLGSNYANACRRKTIHCWPKG